MKAEDNTFISHESAIKYIIAKMDVDRDEAERILKEAVESDQIQIMEEQ